MNKIIISQAIGTSCIIVSANINGLPVERFCIKEETGTGFYVTSDKGVDTRNNNCYFTTIENTLKHIKLIIKEREY
jgi:hypothetical protein